MTIDWKLGLNRFLWSTRSPAWGPKHDQESLLASVRVLLATASLLATYIDPAYSISVARALHILFAFYLLHSVLLWALTRYRQEWVQPFRGYVHVADLLYFACIAAVIQSANGSLYLLYPFWLLILLAAAYR